MSRKLDVFDRRATFKMKRMAGSPHQETFRVSLATLALHRDEHQLKVVFLGNVGDFTGIASLPHFVRGIGVIDRPENLRTFTSSAIKFRILDDQESSNIIAGHGF